MSATETARHIESLVTPFRRRSTVETAEALARFRDVTDAAETACARLVNDLREQGLTWTEIGSILGVTKQAAQQRYGKKPRNATSYLDDDPLPL